ncbi:glycosyltransferase family 39 protein [Microlunatus elymi]|uniref:Glycosyltransferase family 39 protein n=1 Tax=Microlunatus elymi TaxID=2596828 RepID=A0A516Q1I4_9ACTN|nr:glycosyltransferase 87 family protein [Microlunatus elymi]QDP97297.1 glycosyltransferase family 39 protein [Microlunatus elymi]
MTVGDAVPVRRAGNIALAVLGTAIVLVLLTGLLGPSAAQAKLPGGPGWLPPYALGLNPSPLLVTVLLMLAMLLSMAGLGWGMRCVARGWRPPVGRLTWAGAVATLAMIAVPPMGSTDVLFYAVYGRLTALGADPYRDTAQLLIDRGDPIGLATQGLRWTDTTSVYGPVATATQWLASVIGGSSVHATVFVLTAMCAAAYLITGMLLRRMVAGDPARQVRVALLWTINPVLLFVGVNSGHVDTLGVVFAVAALYAGGRRWWPVAGVLLGLACAVKLTFGLFVLAMVLVLFRKPRRLLIVLAGGAVVGVVGYLLVGLDAVSSTLQAGGRYSSAGPLRLLLYPLAAWLGADLGLRVIVILSWLLLVIIAVLLYRRLTATAPPGGDFVARAGLAAAALTVAWVLTAAYSLPWYDIAAWAPVALLITAGPAERLMSIRTPLLVCAYLPGAAVALPPDAQLLTDVVRNGIAPAVGMLLLIAVFWFCRPGVRQRADRAQPRSAANR